MTSFATLCSHLSHHSRNSCCHKDKYFICYHRGELSSELVSTNRLCKVLGTCYHQHFPPHWLKLMIEQHGCILVKFPKISFNPPKEMHDSVCWL